ncbi:transcriptional regulator [Curvibacter sp. HBC28]|uniref:Transcriptional regulator n=1 Tax=Curvibacter microcysteis TaxID=3026419 RepID=A0ABT5M9L9_9BURK|nr:transcriptional regulator [Curvibacter sp. HBC28]MDD0813279.1 transcriptional regulator [Curvibacter sp. HBC28]
MRLPVTSVESVGAAIRAVRKVSGIRQDDVPGVSHVFLRDLEKGKDTVQFGRVIKVLEELGIRMVLEVPESQAEAVTLVMDKYLPKVSTQHTRIFKREGE